MTGIRRVVLCPGKLIPGVCPCQVLANEWRFWTMHFPLTGALWEASRVFYIYIILGLMCDAGIEEAECEALLWTKDSTLDYLMVVNSGDVKIFSFHKSPPVLQNSFLLLLLPHSELCLCFALWLQALTAWDTPDSAFYDGKQGRKENDVVLLEGKRELSTSGTRSIGFVRRQVLFVGITKKGLERKNAWHMA